MPACRYLHEGAQLARAAAAPAICAVRRSSTSAMPTCRPGATTRRCGGTAKCSAMPKAPTTSSGSCALPNLIGGVHLELYDLDDRDRSLSRRRRDRAAPLRHGRSRAAIVWSSSDWRICMRGEYGVADAATCAAPADCSRATAGRAGAGTSRCCARAPSSRWRPVNLDEAWSLAIAIARAGGADRLAQTRRARQASCSARSPSRRTGCRRRRSCCATPSPGRSHPRRARALARRQRARAARSSPLGRDREAETYLTQAAQTIEAIARRARRPRTARHLHPRRPGRRGVPHARPPPAAVTHTTRHCARSVSWGRGRLARALGRCCPHRPGRPTLRLSSAAAGLGFIRCSESSRRDDDSGLRRAGYGSNGATVLGSVLSGSVHGGGGA